MKLIFAGSPDFASDALEKLAQRHEVVLVLTKEDAAVGRQKTIIESSVAKKARDLEIDVIKANRVTKDVIQRITEAGADLGIVIAYGALLPKEVLEIHPWWNLHFSLLPKWRGATPLQRSIQHNEGIGISLFQIDQGLDTGDIIAQLPMELTEFENAGEALYRFSKLGVDLITSALEESPVPRPQIGDASFAPKFNQSESKIDFKMSSVSIERMIRAFNPEPIAWGDMNGKRVRILKAIALDLHSGGGKADRDVAIGSVSEIAGKVVVRCGDESALELLEVQPEGKRTMSAKDWLRGQRTEICFE